MSSILRALRRLEADARPREDDGATLHEHVVLPGTRRRGGTRTGIALGALLVTAVCAGTLLFAVARWIKPRSHDPPALPIAARPASSVPRLVVRPPPPRAKITFAPTVGAPRLPVAAVEAPPPATSAALPGSPARADPDESAKLRVEGPRPRGRGAPVGVERILWHPRVEKRRAWLRVDGEEAAREVREGERVGRYAVTRIDAGSVLFRSGNIELRHKLGTD